ncbi:MAG: right-handed parallel beta-helix repeat-containing protein [Sphingomonadaceae bacterium]|nr:right-handed parallel beta-helix repeat-containing protein [Sphingomonadaceae bacterium]
MIERTNDSRRAFLAATAATSGLFLFKPLCARPAFTPEAFGAKGDGITNDSAAFDALARAVNAARGGTIVLRDRTYLVGAQRMGRSRRFSFDATPLLELRDCNQSVLIEGNGARLRAPSGLRYGVFDRGGSALFKSMPNVDGRDIATPYHAMIQIERCGEVVIRNIELDGNIAGMVIGGQYGDTGWQIPMIGLLLRDNFGSESITGVNSHHHGQDGVMIDGLVNKLIGAPIQRRIVELRCAHNGRQGLSIIGGEGYIFENCSFTSTGRTAISSAPGAGVDIEAEGGKTISAIHFLGCTFADNAGCGMVADSGPSSDARFIRCTFVGTTSWSAWPSKPGYRFAGCTFVGPLVHAFGSANPADATEFSDCLFTDNPSSSPYGRVFAEPREGLPIVDLGGAKGGGQNVRFIRCRFELVGSARLPWTLASTYTDCTMRQRSPKLSYPRGTFAGTTHITGLVDLYGSTIKGRVIINKKTLP